MSIAIGYEADSEGHVYAQYESGDILPTGLTFPSLASRNDITRSELSELIKDAREATA